MTRKILLCLTLIGLIAAVSTQSTADDAMTFAAKKYFPLVNKTRWEYDIKRKSGDITYGIAYRVHCEPGAAFNGRPVSVLVTRLTHGRRRKEVLQREYYHLNEAGDLLCHRRDNGPVTVRFNPPLVILKAKMKVGDTWTWKGTFGTRSASIQSGVLAPEVVTWNKKQISCFKIKTTIRPEQSAQESFQVRTLWLAAEIGLMRESALDVSGKTKVELLGQLHNFYPGEAK